MSGRLRRAISGTVERGARPQSADAGVHVSDRMVALWLALLVAAVVVAVLDEADVDRARRGVALAIESMRALVTRQYEVEAGPADLRGRLQELLDLITTQRGFTFTLEVEEEPVGPAGDLIVSLARELVVNATKHSQGSLVSVRVTLDEEHVVLTVADDGVGFAPGSATGRLRDGHLGLAVVEDRLIAQGGDLYVESGAAGGAVVHARIPRAESAAG